MLPALAIAMLGPVQQRISLPVVVAHDSHLQLRLVPEAKGGECPGSGLWPESLVKAAPVARLREGA
jgi:hypothetical protein